jgi:hypothetical protein
VQIHAVVSVYQGVPEGVKAFLDREEAEIALDEARKEMGIETGTEAESPNHVELFYNVPVQEIKKGG